MRATDGLCETLVSSNRNMSKRVTADEVAKIRQLAGQGYGKFAIARRIGRTHLTVGRAAAKAGNELPTKVRQELRTAARGAPAEPGRLGRGSRQDARASSLRVHEK